MKRLLVSATVLAAIVAGCTGGDDGTGGGITVDPSEYGGFALILSITGAGTVGQAQFFSAVSGVTEPFTVEFGTDECVADTTGGGGGTFTDLDVGASATFETGANQLVMLRDTSGGISYDGFVSTAFPTDAAYTLSVVGTGAIPAQTVGSVLMPSILVPTVGTLTPGEPLEVTWTGGDGASFVVINVDDGSTNPTVSYSCNVANDGSFSIPGDVTTAVGANGSVTVFPTTVELGSLEGRTVLMQSVPF